jgi:phosphatidylinositol alpha-1,6-mannosyltransferase
MRHRKDVDVIDAQGLVTAFVAKILARLFQKRSIVSIHAIFGFKERPLLARVVKWVLASFDVILSFAQKTKDELLAIGLPEDKLTLYISWVDLDIFKPMPKDKCKEALGLQGKFVVLFVGRLIEKKGVNVLLQAAAKADSAITFAFVGDGPLADRLQEQAKVKPNIVYLGKMPNRETPKCFCAADIFAMPSQYEEQFGVVVLETLACGTPIIAANRGGIPEVMDSSVGVLIEPTAEKIAEIVNHLYHNREELDRLAANCRPYAEARYSRDNMAVIERAYDGEKC